MRAANPHRKPDSGHLPAIGSEKRAELLDRLLHIGIALSAEHNRARLLERIVVEAKEICNADGGTLYLRTEEDHLRFAIMRTTSLDIKLGGTTGKPINLPSIPMYDRDSGEPNHHNVATHCALLKESVNIEDAYHADGFDFSGTKKFDRANQYRSQSFLTIPMLNQAEEVIGVLQLLNAHDDEGRRIPFASELQAVVEALASQAAVALENQMLLQSQRRLMESFIKVIAAAIDDKSPYTGGHCRRVPVLTEMLAKAVCEVEEGPFACFNLNEEEWYELHIAGWLHDCGKVTTPVHVMDKATKLETIGDRMETVNARFAALRQQLEVEYLQARARARSTARKRQLKQRLLADQKALEEDRNFVARANIGGEFLSERDKKRIRAVAKRKFVDWRGRSMPLLNKDEVSNLCISRGTLTEKERLVINGHMVQTVRMLEALPFPPNLKRVPEYASGHHEKMDGSGYPRGIYAGDMSVPARIMAIADVFEALTAQDRPYKPGKTLSETMRIMGFMKRDNHLDPDLFDIFVSSRVYLDYAKRYLPVHLIDTVDEEVLLAIRPKSFELPPEHERRVRMGDFLPEYKALIRSGGLAEIEQV